MAPTTSNRLWGKRSSNKLWGDEQGQTRGEIDLRTEMREILHGSTSRPQRGHWVVYRRFDLSSPDLTATATGIVGNYDEVYREGVDGPAYTYTDTVVLTRRDPIFSPELNEAQTPMGVLVGGRDAYYFEYDFIPTVQDQIFEVVWSDHRTKPTLTQLSTPYPEKYNIKEVFPYRSDSGRIEYWVCFVNLDRISY